MIVGVCTTAGSSGATTTTALLAAGSPSPGTLVAECDPSGGDLAAWSQTGYTPGWVTAVAGSDRSWTGLLAHTQALSSGCPVLLAPPRAGEARTAVAEAARGFAGLLADLPGVIVMADCGRIGDAVPAWATRAQLTLLLVRQVAQSAPATVAVVDRALEALDLLRTDCARVGVVLVGGAPYPAPEIEAAFGVPLFGVLPDDRMGAAMVAGAWTAGRASRTPLARAAAELAARAVATLPGEPPADPVAADASPARPGGYARVSAPLPDQPVAARTGVV